MTDFVCWWHAHCACQIKSMLLLKQNIVLHICRLKLKLPVYSHTPSGTASSDESLLDLRVRCVAGRFSLRLRSAQRSACPMHLFHGIQPSTHVTTDRLLSSLLLSLRLTLDLMLSKSCEHMLTSNGWETQVGFGPHFQHKVAVSKR